jgi:hypothetical protein
MLIRINNAFPSDLIKDLKCNQTSGVGTDVRDAPVPLGHSPGPVHKAVGLLLSFSIIVGRAKGLTTSKEGRLEGHLEGSERYKRADTTAFTSI